MMADAASDVLDTDYTPKLDHYQAGSSVRMSWKAKRPTGDEHFQIVVAQRFGTEWKRVLEQDVGKATSYVYRLDEPGSYSLNLVAFRGPNQVAAKWFGGITVLPHHETPWAFIVGAGVVLLLLAILCQRRLKRYYAQGWRPGEWLDAARQWSRGHVLFFLILAASIAVRAAVSFSMNPHLTGDAIDYWYNTEQLYHAFRYVIEGAIRAGGDYYPYPYYPHGMPLLLVPVYGIFGLNWSVLHGINILWDTITIAATFALASRLFGRRSGYVAMTLMAFYPATLNMDFMLFPEQPFTAMMMVTLWLVILVPPECRRTRELLAIGILVGVSILVRPVAMVVPLLLLLYILFVRGRHGLPAKRAIAVWLPLAVGAALPILPITTANWIKFHEFIPVNNYLGVTLWHGNNPKVAGRYNPELETDNPFGDLSYAERNRLGLRLAAEFIFSNPGRFIALAPLKLRYAFWEDGNYIHWWPYRAEDGRDRWVFAIWSGPAPRVYHIVVVGLFVVGLCWLAFLVIRHQVAPEVWLLVMVLGYFVAVVIVFLGQPKWIAPIVPVMCVFAAIPLKGRYAGPATPPTSGCVGPLD